MDLTHRVTVKTSYWESCGSNEDAFFPVLNPDTNEPVELRRDDTLDVSTKGSYALRHLTGKYIDMVQIKPRFSGTPSLRDIEAMLNEEEKEIINKAAIKASKKLEENDTSGNETISQRVKRLHSEGLSIAEISEKTENMSEGFIKAILEDKLKPNIKKK